jgi:hypothetical protein
MYTEAIQKLVDLKRARPLTLRGKPRRTFTCGQCKHTWIRLFILHNWIHSMWDETFHIIPFWWQKDLHRHLIVISALIQYSDHVTIFLSTSNNEVPCFWSKFSERYMNSYSIHHKKKFRYNTGVSSIHHKKIPAATRGVSSSFDDHEYTGLQSCL